AADEVAAARSQGEFADVVPDAVAGGGGRLGEDLEGDRQQGVSRQDGDALPILDVAGGPSPAEIVVVHAGEVVVHQRVGVDALDGGGGRERGVVAAATGFRRGQAEDGTKPFSAGEEAVAHGFVQRGWTRPGPGQVAVQGLVDEATPGIEIGNHDSNRAGGDGDGVARSRSVVRRMAAQSSSAICTAFRAAPLRTWSPTTQKVRALSRTRSLRIRPTRQSSPWVA